MFYGNHMTDTYPFTPYDEAEEYESRCEYEEWLDEQDPDSYKDWEET